MLIVNDNYKHYAGEIQIVKIPIVNDGTRNRIGHLDEEEYQMLDLVYDGDLVEFLQCYTEASSMMSSLRPFPSSHL